MKPRRAVLDTNVLVSALMSPLGNPARIYRMFFAGALVLVYNESILSEYEDVLHRPYLRISTEDADKVLNAIKLHGEHVESTPSTFPMTDEDDRAFYDTAKSSDAYLVTGNTRHYPNESFILTPIEFLEL
jgi:putative PIN family toxin of toxin-antitoxin system